MRYIDAAMEKVNINADLTEEKRTWLLNGIYRDIIDTTCPADWGLLVPKCVDCGERLHINLPKCVDCWTKERGKVTK